MNLEFRTQNISSIALKTFTLQEMVLYVWDLKLIITVSARPSRFRLDFICIIMFSNIFHWSYKLNARWSTKLQQILQHFDCYHFIQYNWDPLLELRTSWLHLVISQRGNSTTNPTLESTFIQCTGLHPKNYAHHDDVINWNCFPRYWPFVPGIHRSPVNSRHKGQWRGALMFSLICAWINGWVNNGEAGDLRCHGAHCDVIVTQFVLCCWGKVSDDFSYILQGYFTGTGAISWLPQCQWSNPEGYETVINSWYNHNKTKYKKTYAYFMVHTVPQLTFLCGQQQGGIMVQIYDHARYGQGLLFSPKYSPKHYMGPPRGCRLWAQSVLPLYPLCCICDITHFKAMSWLDLMAFYLMEFWNKLIIYSGEIFGNKEICPWYSWNWPENMQFLRPSALTTTAVFTGNCSS